MKVTGCLFNLYACLLKSIKSRVILKNFDTTAKFENKKLKNSFIQNCSSIKRILIGIGI